MASLKSTVGQLFPGKPTFTENNILDQVGKVFMVTGGNAGLGFELVKILYSKGAKVYMASRTQSKAEAAIETIKATTSNTSGDVKFIHLDTADLTTIKPAVEAFAAQESKLDVLFNNAGVGAAPPGSKTKQDHDLIIGTNALGPYLLTKLLLPYLQAAAKTSSPNSVRIIWAGSPIIEGYAPQGGLSHEELSSPGTDSSRNYAISKVGNWYLASEFAKRVGGDGIVSVAQNPGNLKTKIWHAAPKVIQWALSVSMHPPIYGAYSNLWAGFSKDITTADGGKYGVPWGKWHSAPREDLVKSLKSQEEGGTGDAAVFWTWCEEQTKSYA